CDFDQLFTYGGRSFSIFDASGNLVFDSGNDFERITAELLPANFNSDNDENTFDTRSDAKGPEPEAVAVGVIDGRTFAFIGLERVGGIMVYDVSNPTNPLFVQYINNRDFAGDPAAGTAGDLGPEGIVFISAADSPTGSALLAVANEVSGTTTLFDIESNITQAGSTGENLVGTDGNDFLFGGPGNDTITGGLGDDLLRGGPGSDALTGDGGSDTFVLAPGEGTDTITDFSVGEDFIGLAEGLTFGQLSISDDGCGNALIRFNNETLAVFNGVDANLLTDTVFTTSAI
ncbi:MAG: calcium-binding protein, partial [Symploca sp. SIO3E6]|nr:calcium-binding protein [Caldora sp. SIO3E6]